MILYLGVSSAVVNPALTFAPLLVGGMVTTLGFSTSSAVAITSTELVATSLAFIPALWWVTRLSWKRVATYALFAVTLGNILSVSCDSFASLVFVRGITGLFEGTLLIVYMVVTAQVDNTERLFGGKLALQMLSVVAGLALFPLIILEWGVSAVYAVLAVLTGALLFGVNVIPNNENRPPITQKKTNQGGWWGYLSLLSLLMFAAGTNVVWTYLERIGTASNLAFDIIGYILAAAISIAIVSGLFCAAIGLKFGRLIPISVGLLAGVLGCWLLKSASATMINSFALGAFLIGIAKVIPLPYLFGCLAVFDNNKRLAIFSHVVLSLGMAGGPLLAVLFVQDSAAVNVVYIGLVVLVLTWVLAIKLTAAAKQAQQTN